MATSIWTLLDPLHQHSPVSSTASCLPNAVDTQCLSRTLCGIWQHCSRPGFWCVTVLHPCRQLALLLPLFSFFVISLIFCPPLMHCCLLGLVFVIIPRSSCVPVTSRWIYSIHASLLSFRPATYSPYIQCLKFQCPKMNRFSFFPLTLPLLWIFSQKIISYYTQ